MESTIQEMDACTAVFAWKIREAAMHKIFTWKLESMGDEEKAYIRLINPLVAQFEEEWNRSDRDFFKRMDEGKTYMLKTCKEAGLNEDRIAMETNQYFIHATRDFESRRRSKMISFYILMDKKQDIDKEFQNTLKFSAE